VGALSEACLRLPGAGGLRAGISQFAVCGDAAARRCVHDESSTLALAPLALSLSAPALSASTSALEEVVITASRSEQTAGINTAFIDVISEEDIKASGAQTVLDALRRSAIIQVVDSSGSGSAPTIGMRGFGSNGSQNTLILIDGRRLNNDTDLGNVNLRNLSINNVARIEIVNGSAGALYGAGAVGGIINIITKRANGNELDLSVSRGSYDTEKYRARASAQKTNGVL